MPPLGFRSPLYRLAPSYIAEGDKLTSSYEERTRKGPRFAWLLGVLILLVVLILLIAVTVRYIFRPASAPLAPRISAYPLLLFPLGILFFFLLVFLILRIVLWPWGHGYQRAYWRRHGEAGEIARARYARGEITKEQFDQIMKDLDDHS